MTSKKTIVSVENGVKKARSHGYNYNFRYSDGFFMRWGSSFDDDPLCAPSPEILDIEISTVCSGINNKPCSHCYKSNTSKGKNMTFETFKIIFDKFPIILTQIAFGIGNLDANPDLWKMMEYCRNNEKNIVIPNITINGWKLTEKDAGKLARVCGAVAVSRYKPKDVCYDAVKKLNEASLKRRVRVRRKKITAKGIS